MKSRFENMEIIRPAHNLAAERVRSWRDIREEAEELREFVRHGRFIGNYAKAFSVSHAQVSEAPKRFFVVNEDWGDKDHPAGTLVKYFGHWCIMNLEILAFDDEVYWKEACMSFPHREPKNTDRYRRIKVEYQIPFLGFSRKVKRNFKDLPAFLSQHENDHQEGRNLYAKENR